MSAQRCLSRRAASRGHFTMWNCLVHVVKPPGLRRAAVSGRFRPPMPIPSPFHDRTAPLCTSFRWKDWSGYAAVCSFDTTHDREYFAFRESAGLLDVSPLYKYEVYGPDAAALLSRMMVRDVSKLKVGRVGYSCWCDDHGKVIDDGTVTRLDEDY